MIIIGIDPGTRVTGYGIIRVLEYGYEVLDYGCIRPPPTLKLTDRYLIIFEGVEELLDRHNPKSLIVETQFVQKNPQSAIKLGMARGIVVVAAKKRGMGVYEYAPSKAKRAVAGNGRASKQQVQGMVKQLLGLSCLPEPEDAADALALALCHAQSCRFKQAIGVEI
jgi:crossover junction endodeoxyribonuclease RuvC